MTAIWSAAELITATKLNLQAAFHVQTITALQGIDTTLFADYYLCTVLNNGGYIFDPSSSEYADEFFIVTPTTGGGRWYLVLPDSDVIWDLVNLGI